MPDPVLALLALLFGECHPVEKGRIQAVARKVQGRRDGLILLHPVCSDRMESCFPFARNIDSHRSHGAILSWKKTLAPHQPSQAASTHLGHHLLHLTHFFHHLLHLKEFIEHRV